MAESVALVRRKGVGIWRIASFGPTNMDYVRQTWLDAEVLPRLAVTARRCVADEVFG